MNVRIILEEQKLCSTQNYQSSITAKHLQCLISDHRRDDEINYNITTKYTVRQMSLFRKLLLQTTYYMKRKEKKKNVALEYCNKKESEIYTESQFLR